MRRWCFFLYPLMLLLIAGIDYVMGEAASTLNAYEIIRLTLPSSLSSTLPSVTPTFIIGQEQMGAWALPWAWLLYLLWTGLWSAVLCLLLRAGRRFIQR